MHRRGIRQNSLGGKRRKNGYGFVQAKFLPGGNTVVTGDNGGRLRQWDVETGKEQKVVRTNFEGTVTCMTLSPDGKTLATTSNMNGVNTSVYLWDAATLTPKDARLRDIASKLKPRHFRLMDGSSQRQVLIEACVSGIRRPVGLFGPLKRR